MTNQEAIERIKGILEKARESENSVCYVTGYDADSLRMAIAALRKQDGKKPTHEETLYRVLTCPNCKNAIDCFKEFLPGKKMRVMYQHCHFCGQRIDWSDEE